MYTAPLSSHRNVHQRYFSAQFAITSSRAMLNALKVSQMPKDINLACLQMILVSDGSQPCMLFEALFLCGYTLVSL